MLCCGEVPQTISSDPMALRGTKKTLSHLMKNVLDTFSKITSTNDG
jgi:hypothetical protein